MASMSEKRAHLLSIAAITFLVAGCISAPPPAPERVTQELWTDAQREAVRLSAGALEPNDASVTIVHLPIEAICRALGQCPHAAAYLREFGVALFRADRPWQSDTGHHFGIVIHEAAHSLQTTDMGPAAREHQAREIQARWLVEQGGREMAARLARAGESS